MAGTMSVILAATLLVGIQTVKNVNAEETEVQLPLWSFAQGGDYTLNGEQYEGGNGNVGLINSVKLPEETLTGWLGTGDPDSIYQTQSATKTANEFSIDIENNGWDCQWSGVTGLPDRINPWSIRAHLQNIPIQEGYVYTVSFKASATKDKLAYIDFGTVMNGPAPYGDSDVPEGDSSIIKIGTTEKEYTYTFTNWIGAPTMNIAILLGAFQAEHDYAGNLIEDYVPGYEMEHLWNGVVHFSDFQIVSHGLNPEFEEPIPWIPEPTTEEKDSSKYETSEITSAVEETTGVTEEKDSSKYETFEVSSAVEETTEVTEITTASQTDKSVITGYSWSSFSVRDDLHGLPVTEWEQSLLDLIAEAKAEGNEEADSYQSYTEGYFTAAPTEAGFNYYVVNSGWDGTYNPYTGDLMGDNPLGMTVQTSSLPIEKCHKYTISFNIKSTLEGTKTVWDENGYPVKDKNGNDVTEKTYIKHVGFKAYDPVSQDNPAVDFDVIDGADAAGIIELDSRKADGVNVTATITIPSTYDSGSLAVMFALGARLVSYPDEIDMRGNITVSNFQVKEAGIVDDENQETNSGWHSYFGYNEGWYEGAAGSLIDNTETGWAANLEAIGWGGIWGGQVSKKIDIRKGNQYTLRFRMISTNINKFVYIKIDNENSDVFCDWVHLLAGEEKQYEVTFTAQSDATRIRFGIGGDFGDRAGTGTDMDAEYRYGLLGAHYQEILANDGNGDPTAETLIICTDFSLQEEENTAENITTSSESTTVPKNTTPYIPSPQRTTSPDSATSPDSTTSPKEIVKPEKAGKVKFVAAAKKKSAKKLKVRLKKVKNAKKYEIQISTTKTFRKILVSKKVKKVNITVISKKLKGKRKLYIRVRAYIVKNGKTYKGNWSGIKKIKIK